MKVLFYVDNHQLCEGRLSRWSWLRSYLSIKMHPNKQGRWLYLKIRNPKGLGSVHTYDTWKVLNIHPKDFCCQVVEFGKK